MLKSYNVFYVKASKAGYPFNVNNIECVLLIGNVSSLAAEEQEVFDTYRNELRSIRILGFDELLKRIENMLALFERE